MVKDIIRINVGELTKKLSQATLLLQSRYQECDVSGHKKQDENANYCNYCYRHLNYESAEVNHIMDSRKNLPSLNMVLDAPILVEIMETNIIAKQNRDKADGLRKIMEEMKN